MHGEAWEIITGACLGIGLAAACGFRVFVPLLFVSIAVRADYVQLSPGWEWVGSIPALITFATATGLEIAAYYVPWIDHLLDTIAAPVAVVAGTVVTAACIGDIHPMLKWTLAIVAGGGSAAAVQALTTTARVVSTAATGGLGNPLVATAEAGAAVGLSTLAVFLPVAALAVVVVLVIYSVRFVWRRVFAPAEAPAVPQQPLA